MSDIQAEIRTSADGLAHRGLRQNWLARLARAGMVAQGAMYVLVGGLAIELALGLGGKTTNQRGALHTLADEWYGLAALLALAIGFAGYAIWRFAPSSGRRSRVKRMSASGSGSSMPPARSSTRASATAPLLWRSHAAVESRTRRTRRQQPSSTGRPAVGSWGQLASRSWVTASGTATAPSAGTSRRISRSSR